MTYNFDPDRWYDNEQFVIQLKFKSGQVAKQEYDKAIEALDIKYAKMWERLDRSYQLPK
jgi:hypothetical protein